LSERGVVRHGDNDNFSPEWRCTIILPLEKPFTPDGFNRPTQFTLDKALLRLLVPEAGVPTGSPPICSSASIACTQTIKGLTCQVTALRNHRRVMILPRAPTRLGWPIQFIRVEMLPLNPFKALMLCDGCNLDGAADRFCALYCESDKSLCGLNQEFR
jgi:hypothetical protein